MTAPATAGADSDIVVTDTTKNQGTGASLPSKTGFYLSANTTLDAADQLAWRAGTVSSLGPGVTVPASTTLHIPPSTAAGSYRVLAKADWDNTINESSETNNVRSEQRHQDRSGSGRFGAHRSGDRRRGKRHQRLGYDEEPGWRHCRRVDDALLLVDEHGARCVRPGNWQPNGSGRSPAEHRPAPRRHYGSGVGGGWLVLRHRSGRCRWRRTGNDGNEQHEGKRGDQGGTRPRRYGGFRSIQRRSRRDDLRNRHHQESRCRDGGRVVHRILPVGECHHQS